MANVHVNTVHDARFLHVNANPPSAIRHLPPRLQKSPNPPQVQVQLQLRQRATAPVVTSSSSETKLLKHPEPPLILPSATLSEQSWQTRWRALRLCLQSSSSPRKQPAQTSHRVRFASAFEGLSSAHIYQAITTNFGLLEQAVAQFDARFTLRALRSISTVRESPHLPSPLQEAISSAIPSGHPARDFLEGALGKSQNGTANGDASHKAKEPSGPLPEVWAYLGILVQVRSGRRHTTGLAAEY